MPKTNNKPKGCISVERIKAGEFHYHVNGPIKVIVKNGFTNLVFLPETEVREIRLKKPGTG